MWRTHQKEVGRIISHSPHPSINPFTYPFSIGAEVVKKNLWLVLQQSNVKELLKSRLDQDLETTKSEAALFNAEMEHPHLSTEQITFHTKTTMKLPHTYDCSNLNDINGNNVTKCFGLHDMDKIFWFICSSPVLNMKLKLMCLYKDVEYKQPFNARKVKLKINVLTSFLCRMILGREHVVHTHSGKCCPMSHTFLTL